MTKQTKLHAFILATHGVLAMLFGLALLYVLAATRHDFLDVLLYCRRADPLVSPRS